MNHAVMLIHRTFLLFLLIRCSCASTMLSFVLSINNNNQLDVSILLGDLGQHFRLKLIFSHTPGAYRMLAHTFVDQERKKGQEERQAKQSWWSFGW